MAQLLYRLEGARGKGIEIYDRKCVLTSKSGVGTAVEALDTEKTIFYTDVAGILFKRSGNMMGCLQIESSAGQSGNQTNIALAENAFPFENGRNGLTNEYMEGVYRKLCEIVEAIKYGEPLPVPEAPAQEAAKACVHCGAAMKEEAKFCPVCGKAQE